MYSILSTILHAALITLGLAVTSSIAASNDSLSSSSSSSSLSSSSSSSSTSSRIDRILNADEMLFFGSQGRIEVIQRSDYMKYTGGIPIARPEQRYVNFTLDADEETSMNHEIEKRCTKRTVFTMKPAETYVDWDVPMSGVVLAPESAPASVSVSEGFHIQNSMSAAPSGGLTSIIKYMKINFGISYSHSWTTSHRNGYTFTIPPGKFGAVVINPLTTRHSGYVDEGCIGSSKRTEFSGESYQSKSYSDLQWVEGLIGLCVGDTYPLPKCLGEGTL